MKGIVYSGIVYAPDHPDADLHGLIRACIRERSWIIARQKLVGAFGGTASSLFNSKIWQVSKSHVESLATEKHYGEILACAIVRQYLDPKYYKPLKPQKAPKADAVHTGMVPKEL
jgi:hypothetical protein